MKRFAIFVMVSLTVFLSGCGYNSFQTKDEQISAAWAEVLNQYQRRSDLIPNLVAVVEKYASHEKETFVGLAAARASASAIQATPALMNDPAAFKKFQAAQGEIGQFLSKLMVVKEAYPELKADKRFAELQAQLEGTENRITVARNRYIASVRDYNVQTRQFPTNLTAMMFSYTPKPQFTVDNEKEISTAPKVQFK